MISGAYKFSTREKESLPQKFKETFAAAANSALFVSTCTASISTLRPFRERLLPWPLANHLGPFNLNLNLNLLQKPIPTSMGSKTGVPQSNRLNRTAKLCLYPFPHQTIPSTPPLQPQTHTGCILGRDLSTCPLNHLWDSWSVLFCLFRLIPWRSLDSHQSYTVSTVSYRDLLLRSQRLLVCFASWLLRLLSLSSNHWQWLQVKCQMNCFLSRLTPPTRVETTPVSAGRAVMIAGSPCKKGKKPENCLWNKHCWSFLPASHQIAIFNLHHSSKNHESHVCQMISQQTREDLVLLQVPIALSPCKK